TWRSWRAGGGNSGLGRRGARQCKRSPLASANLGARRDDDHNDETNPEGNTRLRARERRVPSRASPSRRRTAWDLVGACEYQPSDLEIGIDQRLWHRWWGGWSQSHGLWTSRLRI